VKRSFKVLKPVTFDKGLYNVGRVTVFDDEVPQIQKYISQKKIIPLENFEEELVPESKAVVTLIAEPEDVKKEAVVSKVESPEIREDDVKIAVIQDMAGTEVKEIVSPKKRKSSKKKKTATTEEEPVNEEPITEEETAMPDEGQEIQEPETDKE